MKQATNPAEVHVYTGPGNYLEEFPLRLQTRYFDFRYRKHPEKIAVIARFADAFIELLNRDFLNTDFNYPIQVLVLEDQRTMDQFLRRRFNESPAMGIYLPEYKLFVTHENSGLGTFTHEIMHPILGANIRNCPPWAFEGIPAFFEKFYGYWSGDALAINWGYQNPWRIDELGRSLGKLDLKSIVNASAVDYESESAQRMVAVFLWKQGKLKRFLDLAKHQDKAGYNSYFEAALEKPIDEIVPEWQEYLNDVVRRRGEIMQLPSSTIFDSKDEYDKFVATHQP